MAYRVEGIRDSKREGWYQHNIIEGHSCSTSRTEIDTPLGTIIVEVASDENYPGVWLSFKENEDNYERTVALLEAESPDSVALKVWKDERLDEDWTHYFPVAQKKDGE